MFARLLFLFVTVPIVEVYLLLQVNELTGSITTTIALILVTGAAGAWLAKQQGISTLKKIQDSMSQGRLPAQELVDGGMILFAAALLLTPGVLTDAFGFSLLLPPCRTVYRRLLKRWFPASKVQFNASSSFQWSGSFGQGERDPNIVDGEARSVPEEPKSIDRQS